MGAIEQWTSSTVCLHCRFDSFLPGEDGILAAAEIKAAHPVSYSDAFAISLTQSEKGSVITGDDEIRRCGAVAVDWLGA